MTSAPTFTYGGDTFSAYDVVAVIANQEDEVEVLLRGKDDGIAYECTDREDALRKCAAATALWKAALSEGEKLT